MNAVVILRVKIRENTKNKCNSKISDNVSRWERTVNDEEERLETCKKQEQKQREEIDKDLQQVEQLKAQRLHKKQEVDGMEEELGKARREVGSIAKDVQAAQKAVVSLETKIEGKKSERHAILMQCKVIHQVFLSSFLNENYFLDGRRGYSNDRGQHGGHSCF